MLWHAELYHHPASRSDVNTASCRPVPGHPSKHGANIDAHWSRPIPGRACKGMAVRRAVRASRFWGLAEAADTVRDPCWHCPEVGLDRRAGTLTISGQMQQLGGRLAVAPPKSDARRRVIAPG